MTPLEVSEMVHYVTTSISAGVAALAFILSKRRERMYDEATSNEKLRDEYAELLRTIVANPGVNEGPFATAATEITPERDVRAAIIDKMAVALFSRAFAFSHEYASDRHRVRLWTPWRVMLEQWMQNPSFVAHLDETLADEDEAFVREVLAARDQATTGKPRLPVP